MGKILVIHGPNLGLLGRREPDIYGKIDLEQINSNLYEKANELNLSIDIVQFDNEGDIVSKIGDAEEEGYSAIVLNPAAYTHTSIAIYDAIKAISIPVIEVHLSNIYGREEFRRKSLTAPVCKGVICGFGRDSYILALDACVRILK